MDFLYEHEQATRYTDSDSEFESTSETSPDPSTPRRPRNPPLADRGASTTVFRASPLWQSRSSTSGLDALVVAVGPDACDVLRRRLAEPLVPLAIAIPFTGAKATRPHGSAVKANPYFILAQADNPGTGYVLLADELDLLSLHSWGHTILKHMTPTRVFILQSLTVLQRESLIEGIMHRQYTDDGAEVEALRYLKSPGAPQVRTTRA
ncbi:hypothetical protein IWQ60_002930 [Tieghemiomyces parasiticus]|uniref:Uncharacterized protein n=1 Tax=Tieghemiomyces parasiticus TaxID=78921 RepID=A0A9W8E160_9FUNG|nr:hypothetical protein IWQ60_002930 [Tieghemiomyces parasiticus]